ncbi:MAG: apolipoprotein N-acyltransferase [Rhodospirillales bacterium]|nr:apolipoprotein N-acyltransferase [Rhodospirillales bacterium]
MHPRPFLKKILLCFAAGSFCALSMPPYGLTPALFVALSLFYVLVESASKGLFLLGWAFGFGYFLIGVSWIGDALLVGGNPWRWAWPLAAMALPAILALYPALVALVHARIRPAHPAASFAQFVALMAIAEFLRGHLFTGFPWNLYGYGWGGNSPVSQTAALWGSYGLSALTIFWAVLPGYLWRARAGALRPRLILAGAGIASLTACYGFGLWRLHANPPAVRSDVRVVLVQPSIPQSEKWTSEKMVAHFEKHLALSRPNAQDFAAPKETTTLIVWPETAIAWPILDSDQGLDAIEATLRAWPGKAFLATGVLLRSRTGAHTGYRNSIALIDQEGGIPWIHDKAHLVPFGEYIPFQKWIPIPTVTGFSGFEAGGGPDTLSAGEALSVSPLVCYEIIFPSAGINPTKPRPDALLNVTNDGWYGKSAGPYQHFENAIFRAIESGVPVIRAANTGISAVIDPMGRTVARMPLLEAGAARAGLPPRLSDPTFYNRTGNALFLFILTGLIATRFIFRKVLEDT